MRVLFISTIAPYPKSVGKKVVLGGFVDYFRQVCAPGDFKMVCFEPAAVPADVEVTVVQKPGLLRKLWNLCFSSLLTRHKSIQESLFWSRDASNVIDAKIAQFAPDMVLFDTVRTGQYLSGVANRSFRSVLYMDDLFSVRYERILHAMANFPGAGIDAMGNFASNIPRFLMPLYRSSAFVKRLLLGFERDLVQKTEYRMPSDFDLALLISQEEVRYLMTEAVIKNVRVVSPLLGMDQSRVVARSWDGRSEFVFLGSLNLAHNAFSIETFIERHMEQMLDSMPDCVLRIIGRFPSPRLQAMAEKFSGHVTIEGFVNDLDVMLARCAAMVAPLLFGSGVKIKVIDAVRLGVPVISTTYGAEGITLRDDGGILVEDDLSLFASLCKGLLDPSENARHSELSRQIYLEHYSPAAVEEQYGRLFAA
ncbi:MAG: glycosyltransferase [Rhodocyclaceae bacterium]